MEPDYTPQDAGNSTHQVGDKYYKTPEEIEVLLSDSEKFDVNSEPIDIPIY